MRAGQRRCRRLVPYVPRLTIEWLRDEPERLWRELDGTVAFFDIRGFTAMSKRLARFGKAGGSARSSRPCAAA